MQSDANPRPGEPRRGTPDPDAGDAIALLSADHEDVRRLFAEYDELVADGAGAEERGALAEQICTALTAHAQIEEELFYPAAREALQDAEQIDEAEAEHASARALIDQIQGLEADDELFDATMRLLQEAVEHHVDEEEGALFPLLAETELDLETLGEQLAARRDEVLSELGAGS